MHNRAEHKPTLDSKLRELLGLGVVTLNHVYRPGFGVGSVWCFENRRLKIVSGYFGQSSFVLNDGTLPSFREPHDLAIDEASNTIIACALS